MIGWVKQGGGGLVDFEVSNYWLKEVVGWVWFVRGDDVCCGFVCYVGLQAFDVGFGIKVFDGKELFCGHLCLVLKSFLSD
jgi:hypothetical protein